jgi:hypothetical protein
MTDAKEISKYKLHLVGVQDARWDTGDKNQQANVHFSTESAMRIIF